MGVRPLTLIIGVALVGPACRRSEGGRDAPPSIAYESYVRAGGTEPAGGKLTNPFGQDSQSVKMGATLFSAMNCDGCHGGGALGWVGPSLVDGRWRYGGNDGELFHSIFYGRPRGMPAYGGMLSTDATWKLITYIRAQPVPKTVPTQTFDAH